MWLFDYFQRFMNFLENFHKHTENLSFIEYNELGCAIFHKDLDRVKHLGKLTIEDLFNIIEIYNVIH